MALASVSLLGQTTDQVNRIRDLRNQMATAQRQITTEKKSDLYSGLGVDGQRLQRFQAESISLKGYIDGLDEGIFRTKVMTQSVNSITRTARDLQELLRLQVRDGEIDIRAINELAQDGLDIIKDLLNTEVNGRHLFAGTDSDNPPVAGFTNLVASVGVEFTSWLSGGQTATTLIADVDAISGTSLGYSSTLQFAGDVFVRADVSLEVNNTLKADLGGFQELIRAFSIAAELKQPDPDAGDIPGNDQFQQILDNLVAKIAGGIEDIEQESFKLATRQKLMDTVRTRHVDDQQTLESAIENVQAVDMAEVITRLKTLETQMQASFEATALISNLTLVNFLN